ncbi:hypothetical protein ACSS6W_009189 [Trichoderma asperelloides]
MVLPMLASFVPEPRISMTQASPPKHAQVKPACSLSRALGDATGCNLHIACDT